MGEIPPSWVDMLWSRVWFLGNNRIMFSFAVISGIEWGTGDEKQKESVALYQLFMGELSAVCMISFSFKLLIWNVLEVREKKLSSISPHLFRSASLHFSFDPRISAILTLNGYRAA